MKENRIADLNAELGILSAMLIDDSILPQAIGELKEEYFYHNNYRKIFQAIKKLYDRQNKVDLITLADELKMEGIFDTVGGVQILNLLSDFVNSAVNYPLYLKILKDKYRLRELLNICNSSIIEITSAKASAEDILNNIITSILSMDFTEEEKKLVSLQELIRRYADCIDPSETENYIDTGFPDIDKLLGSLSAGQLVILAGRPSMGKTALALQIMKNVAIRQGKTVIFYSIEQSNEEILSRLLAQKGIYSMDEIFGLKMTKREIASYLQSLENSNIYLNDYGKIKTSDIRNEINIMKKRGIKPDLLIIDYLQLLTSERIYKSKYEEVSAISRDMKILAKDLRVPILILSQLNRDLENREDKRPRLSDLRDSGNLEQDADKVLFLYRDEVYNKDTDYPGIVEVIVRKNRNGKRGTAMLYFNENYITFNPVDNG
ncbi:MAG: replicative DNA helicase [Candidatus Cloacimonas acidaminovorans]|nr:replicative DNA helicase [Candidatus Cloacimonas acidaminovorans]